MNVIYNGRQSTKKDQTILLFLITFIFTALFFFVDIVNAQVADSYRLIGMIRSIYFTGVVLSDPKGEQSFYRLFDKLSDGSQIVAVRSDSISLKGADGTSYDMYIAHDTKTAASVKSDVPADPFAGAIRKTPEERQPSAYERRRQKRLGKQNSNDE
jgi:hypothetical protein